MIRRGARRSHRLISYEKNQLAPSSALLSDGSLSDDRSVFLSLAAHLSVIDQLDRVNTAPRTKSNVILVLPSNGDKRHRLSSLEYHENDTRNRGD